MWLHSAVADYRLTGSEEAKVRGLNAASVLAGRYNPNGKFIRAWNPECVEEGEDCTGWIIVDSMMNIPLLYWAGQITGDPRFQQIAVNHADTVASYLVREDGSCGHIACINPDTGELEHILGGQGYSETSSWSRVSHGSCTALHCPTVIPKIKNIWTLPKKQPTTLSPILH